MHDRLPNQLCNAGIKLFTEHSLLAIVRTDSPATALAAAKAVVRGGFRLVEITLTTPGAEQVIRQVSLNKDVLVGCGTVLTPNQAREAIHWGAHFVVSPHTDQQIIETAHKLGALAISGALTPTEIVTAWQAGADLVKIFPVTAVGGIDYLRNICTPLPSIPLLPTGGIGENFLGYLHAGAAAVGLGQSLIPAEEVAKGEWDAIARRACDWVARANRTYQ